MKIKQMKSILATNKFDNCECNFKLKTGKPKITLDFIASKLDEINNRLDKIDDFIDTQKEFNKFVLDQFKKHGWTN